MIYRYLLAVHERRYENPLHEVTLYERVCHWLLLRGPFAGRYWRDLTYIQSDRMRAWRTAAREQGFEVPAP